MSECPKDHCSSTGESAFGVHGDAALLPAHQKAAGNVIGEAQLVWGHKSAATYWFSSSARAAGSFSNASTVSDRSSASALPSLPYQTSRPESLLGLSREESPPHHIRHIPPSWPPPPAHALTRVDSPRRHRKADTDTECPREDGCTSPVTRAMDAPVSGRRSPGRQSHGWGWA